MKIVAVSGGFDPLHVGHLRHIKEAATLGDELLIILSRDEQLITKKGFVFMPYKERKEILEALPWVTLVKPNIDKTLACSKSLREYKPDIFAKGGDRAAPKDIPYEEIEICQLLNIQIVWHVGGGKIQSSSALVKGVIR